ncbi:hypothetical protein HCX50_04005 [Microbacterium oxydans]|nr:hypothetical protein [Microbacterium sp. B19(2022)]
MTGAVESVGGTHSALLILISNRGNRDVVISRAEALSFPYVFLDQQGFDHGDWSIGAVDLVKAFASCPAFTPNMRAVPAGTDGYRGLVDLRAGAVPQVMFVVAPAVRRPCGSATVEVRLMAPEEASAFMVRLHHPDGSFGDFRVAPPWGQVSPPVIQIAMRDPLVVGVAAEMPAAVIPASTPYGRFSWPFQRSLGVVQF